MFNVGDRVRYTGRGYFSSPEWIGRTGVVQKADEFTTSMKKTKVRWDKSGPDESIYIWPFLDNLELVKDEPEAERDWIVLLMDPGGRKPVPFGPYTLDEVFDVLEKGLVETQGDEYLVKTRLRTDVR